jgi:adenylate cyclase
MTKEKEQDLVFRVAKLINENKELSTQVKDLTKENNRLLQQNLHYKNILGKLPRDLIPKDVKPDVQPTMLRFKMATVMYVDIQGFKRISELHDSTSVIDELDQIFYHFDKIVKKYKIQKIKTIGDAYMCAGGVPEKNITNPIDVVLAALEMREYLNVLKINYDKADKTFWDLRIGLHTGPVTATVHGKKKISYDIKGDTVHIATRMASASDISKINISVMTYELIKEYFNCEYHGKIPVKYIGDMEMYYMKRLKPAYSQDRKKGIFPNEIFNVKYLIRQFTDLQELILDRLEKELPEKLYYHNVKHTIDVVNQAELIGYGEGVDDEGILMLMTAALFHDAGHTVSFDDHEFYGTKIARDMLPKFNYTREQIDKICEIIMATKLPPKPQSLLQKIICDSDLDYLGRSDFIPVSNTLFKELKAHGKLDDLNEWNKIQVNFLSKHQFFTNTANRLREVNKQKQIERISKLIHD